MKLEAEERIVYRFTRGEVAALLQVMGLEGLPGLDIVAEAPTDAAAGSLVEAGFVMIVGERTYVDRTISLVLHEAASCRASLCARLRDMDALLCRGGRLCVLITLSGELVSMEPLPDMECAGEAFRRLIREHGPAQALTLRRNGTTQSVQGETEAALREME